ncbi:LuxR family transcriptional regulator, partial [Actinomadura logoneensis]
LLLAHADDAAPSDVRRMLRAAAAHAWTSGDTGSVRAAASRLADDPFTSGLAALAAEDYATGLPLLDRAVRDGGPDALQAAVVLGADERAFDLATTAVSQARRQGRIGALPDLLEALARVQLAMGLHADAEASATEARALARDTGLRPRGAAVLARLAALQGDETGARALTAGLPSADLTRALLDLALGRHDEVVRRLEDVFRGPHRHAAEAMAASADLVEAALRTDRPEPATTARARLARWADTSGQAWAGALALRCEALLTDAEEPFVRALELHDQATRPFEKARTELAYGEWLRRHRRRSDARPRLHSALETFDRLRATPWSGRVRAELRASGEGTAPTVPAATAPLDRLTPQELQVVRLAAEGVSSREIAAQLFLSPRTVEYHLYKAYPKLGVSSRRELSRIPLATPA